MSVDTDATPPEMVRVPSTTGGGSDRVYHTAECRYVRHYGDGMRKWPRDLAEAWGIEECRTCYDIRTETNNTDD